MISSAKPSYILGLSCFYHDSAACLVQDGEIVAAAEEERFTRIKNDRQFPHRAVNFCLEQAGIHQNELRAVVYYDNAFQTFERLIHTLAAVGDDSQDAWLRIMPPWIHYKLHLPTLIRRYLQYDGLIFQEVHHRSHAASAFYPSPFVHAAILTVDGVGEWATASISVGSDNQIQLLKEMRFPHSVGLLYSAFTQFTGFKVNSGEYKMMGMAPYGEPRYVERIYEHLVDLKEDGSVELNLAYFAYLSEQRMTNDRFAELFGGPARQPESQITRREMDLACSIQKIIEECVLRMVRYAHKLTGERNLCLAGGVALNCVANGRVLREGPFDALWIQPAAGDAGGALGAALDAYYTYYGQPRKHFSTGCSGQGGSYLGPDFGETEIRAFLESNGYSYRVLDSEERAEIIASFLNEGKVVGHFSGRMEFGPRSLGARSIIGDARNSEMQANLNLKIKYRESFRPFAPTVLAERVSEYFELDGDSPYMLLVAPVKRERRLPLQPRNGDDMLSVVRQVRSDIPAVTHVDYSTRIQTVKREHHPVYYDLIEAFERLTGYGLVVNTSFNVRGEPIVCTPRDAYRCFMRTNMDVLILENCLLLREEQPKWRESEEHIEEYSKRNIEISEDKFTIALRKIFVNDFLPVAADLRRRGVVEVRSEFERKPTMWVDYSGDQSHEGIFAIPEQLDKGKLSAQSMAAAITEFWSIGSATEALRPILEMLLEVGMRFPAQEQLDEQVSGSTYVMF